MRYANRKIGFLSFLSCYYLAGHDLQAKESFFFLLRGGHRQTIWSTVTSFELAFGGFFFNMMDGWNEIIIRLGTMYNILPFLLGRQ